MGNLKRTALAFVALVCVTVGSYAALLDFKEMNRTIATSESSFGAEDIRTVASKENTYSVLYFPLNDKNYERIKGKWQIYNFIDNEDIDHKINKVVDFELIGNGRIKVDNDNEQIFRLSFLTDQNTIAIFKKVGEGFEILEAVKLTGIKPSLNKGLSSTNGNNELGSYSDDIPPKGVNLEQDVDLVLERGFNPNISKNIFVGDSISGTLSIVSGQISGLRVVIAKGLREEQSIDIEHADIKDGGVFEVDSDSEMTSGIISNFGQGIYRVRFATGPMKGAMLNFVTQEEMDRLQEIKPVNAPNPEERSLEVGDNSQKTSEEYASERKAISQNTQTMETPSSNSNEIENNVDEAQPVEEISKEQMDENLSQSGFDFNQKSPVRAVSSIELFAK